MNYAAARTLLGGAFILCCLQSHAQVLAPEMRNVLPSVTLMGQAKMTYWGFDVYHAGLWVEPGFDAGQYHQARFALSLTYLRSLQGSEIAKRSIVEMRRQGPMTAQEEDSWEGHMRDLFPNVNAGDNLTGVHVPGRGAEFWSGGRKLGEVRDAAFSQRFFGIWLSPQTSEPALRHTLLSGVKTP